MKKKKISKNNFLTIVFVLLCGCFICGCSSKKTKIVWYISEPESYGVEKGEIAAYQEIETECFKLFNERLEELNIPAKVVFKYMPDRYEGKSEDFESGDLFEKEFPIPLAQCLGR